MTAVAAPQGTAPPPRAYADAGQIEQIAAGHVAFASELLAMGERMPVRATHHQETCHLPDLKTLRAYAAGLGMDAPAVKPGTGQWRSELAFGPAFTYVLWTEAAT